jgi:hypothetical protein
VSLGLGLGLLTGTTFEEGNDALAGGGGAVCGGFLGAFLWRGEQRQGECFE